MENKKIQYVQGIRAIACITIALVHFFGRFYQDINIFLISQMGRILLAPFRGSVGVVTFAIFVGYFASSYSKKYGDNLGEYLTKRYFKTWITVLLMGILWFILNKFVLLFNVDVSSQFSNFIRYDSLFQYVLNSILINDRTLTVFWPLLSYFVGSVIVSLIFKYSSDKLQRLIILLFIGGLTFYLGNKVIISVCIGSILKIMQEEHILDKVSNSWFKYFLFILGWILISYDDKSTRIGFFILTIGASLILIAISKIDLLKKLLSNKFLSHIGGLSFEIYSIHFVIVALMIIISEMTGFNNYHNYNKITIISLTLLYLAFVYFSSLILKLINSSIYQELSKYIEKVIRDISENYLNIKNTFNENDTWFFIVIGIFLVLLSSYVSNASMGSEGYLGIFSMDYAAHNAAAQTIFDGIKSAENIYMEVVFTYPLYHITSKVISIITGLDIHFSSSVAICFYIFFTIILVRQFLITSCPKMNKLLVNTLSLGSVFVLNLYIPSFVSTLYFPQGSANLWHNPTYIVSRPFALIASYSFLNFFKKNTVSKSDYIYMTLGLLLCLLAKPNFALVFYPVSGLMIFIKFCLNPKNNFKHLFYWILAIIPSILLNLYQFSNMHLTVRTGGTLLELKWPFYMAINYFIIVMVFPIFVAIFEGYKKYKDINYIFVWGISIVGFIQYYITKSGNFIWGYEIAIFMLVFYSSKILFTESNNKIINNIGASIWGAQLLIGILYFATGLFGSNLFY